MPAVDQTPAFKLNLPTFDLHAWHTYVNENFSIIDAVLNHYLDIQNLVGVWRNSTAYTVGQRTIDPADGSMYECIVAHTSAAAPTTFTQDRAANPSYWGGFISGVSTHSPTFTGVVSVLNPGGGSVSVEGSLFAQSTIELNALPATDAYYYAAISNGAGGYTGWGFGDRHTDGHFIIEDGVGVRFDIAPGTGLVTVAQGLTVGGQTNLGNVAITGTATAPTQAAHNNSTRIATTAYVDSAVASSVISFNSRTGAVTLTLADVTGVGGAPIASPALTGVPTAPTAAPGNNTTQLATTAFVTTAVAAFTGGVTSFNTRSGAVVLSAADVTAAGGALLASPALTGTPTVPTATAGTSTTQAASTAFVTTAVAAVPAGPTGPSGPAGSSLNNYLHNPLFNIAQRGNGPWTANNLYTVDRCWNYYNNGTISSSRIALVDADRTAIGDEAATWALQHVVSGGAAAGDFTQWGQSIESMRRLAGKTVTVSFWAKNLSTKKVGVCFFQNFGSGGSPSANAFTTGQSVTITSTWTRYSLTFAIPSLVGKTLGTNGDDSLQLTFWLSAGTTSNTPSGSVGVQNGTFTFWGIQVELGGAMGTLDKPDFAKDWENCTRYYQVLKAINIMYQAGAMDWPVGVSYSYLTPMRATPISALINTTITNCYSIAATSNASTVQVSVWSSAAGVVGYVADITLTADI